MMFLGGEFGRDIANTIAISTPQDLGKKLLSLNIPVWNFFISLHANVNMN
jgi:hypothetical protein